MTTFSRSQAWQIVCDYVQNINLRRHMLAVEAAMVWYAEKFGEDGETWAVTGLLHDFDWEIHPTLDQHPQAGAPILRELGVPEEIVHAVLTHASHLALPRETLLQKALFACDEITGLVTAAALVRPTRSVYDVEIDSVRKKWGQKAFAAGVNREEVAEGAKLLGIDLWEHVGNVILAMQARAESLGLARVKGD
ncbi:MAG TPA: HDIG domain-containing protein [Anaerolineales bacterium]|nr:HDIG domain-containing protein [Anaerolineales bacterium]